jgi:hypothetical protein
VDPSNSDAFITPVPQVKELEEESHLFPANAVTLLEVFMLVSINCGVNDGLFASINATTPATCGAAILVPW